MYLQLISKTPFDPFDVLSSLFSVFNPKTAERPEPTFVKSADTGQDTACKWKDEYLFL